MSRTALCFTITLFAIAACGQENGTEIKQWSERFVAAWNRNDVDSLAALWAPEGDLINPFGRHARGRSQVQRLLQSEHTASMLHTTYLITNSVIRFAKPDVALLDWDSEISDMKTADGTQRPPFKHHMTWVLVLRGGDWFALAARAASPSASPADGLR